MNKRVYTFTDFSHQDYYLALMDSALWSHCPDVQIIPLHAQAPQCNPRAAAYLLAALMPYLLPQTYVLAVVDPGVGTDRGSLLLETGEHILIGPDNGLLSQVAKQAPNAKAYALFLDASQASVSFHGRDLFAPAIAQLACGRTLPKQSMPLQQMVGWRWPLELAEIIYIDHFGNLITGLKSIQPKQTLLYKEQVIQAGRTFGEVERGELFYYVNSIGLLEIAANQASAAQILGAKIGDGVRIYDML